MATQTLNWKLWKAVDGDNGNDIVKTKFSANSDAIENALGLGSIFNVKSPRFGALGDGSTNDTQAITAAVAAIAAAPTGGVLYFPKGNYRVNGTFTLSADVAVVGDGIGITNIYQDGLSLDLFLCGTPNCTFRDFAVAHAVPSVSVGGAAIKLIAGAVGIYIARMQVEGVYTAIKADDAHTGTRISQVCVSDLTIINNAGPGISVAAVGQDVKIANCMLGGNLRGIEVADVFDSLLIANCFLNTNTEQGILLKPGATNPVRNVSIVNTQVVGTAAGPCMEIDGTPAGRVYGISLANCKFKSARGTVGHGLYVRQCDGLAISNCDFLDNEQNGLLLGDLATAAVPANVNVVGGIVSGNSVISSGAHYGVRIRPGVNDFNVANVRVGPSSHYADTQAGGIQIEGGGSVRYSLLGNDVVGNTAGVGISDGSAVSNKRVHNNRGYNPIGPVAAPAIPLTTVALTNPFGTDATVYVAGGTVTVIAVGGTATGFTPNATVRVPAGSTITLTYTVAPTWTWFLD